MADDWRLTVRLGTEHEAELLLAALHAEKPGDDEQQLERVAVSASGSTVFLYADSEGDAHRAEEIVRRLLAARSLAGEPRLQRWHPVEAAWEEASVPLPESEAERSREHERLEREEAEESEATGVAAWELRIELPSSREARDVERQLEREGFGRLLRRSHYLIVGTVDADEAAALARRLERELPAAARIHVEPGGGLVWQVMPGSRFAVFGGLGG